MNMLRLLLTACAIFLATSTYAQAPAGGVLCCDQTNDAVVAVVDGEHVRMSDLEQYSRSGDPLKIFLLNQQLRDPREQLAQDSEDQRVLQHEAQRQHLTVTRLLEQLSIAPVTEPEIEKTLGQINAQRGPDRPPLPLDHEARQLIVSYLIGQKTAAARGLLIQNLKRAANGNTALPPCDCASCRLARQIGLGK